MKKVNFYKVYSRLGLFNLPLGGDEPNYGVENAPNEILTPEFLQTVEDYNIYEYKFPLPEDIKKEDYFKVMAAESLRLKDLIIEKQKIDPSRKAVLVGGDHSVSFGSIMAQMELQGAGNVGVIHFDSHDDCCSLADSPTQNFHGMFLRALTDKDFDNKHIRGVVKNILRAEDLLIIGNIDCKNDPQGKYLEKMGIKYYELDDINKDKNAFNANLARFLETHSHIHISFDIDVFDKTLVSATGTPSENGFMWEDVDQIMRMLEGQKSVSMDLVEVNLSKGEFKNTLNLVSYIIKALIL